MVVVDAPQGDPFFYEEVGVDRNIGIGVDEAGQRVPTADAQHLHSGRDHGWNTANLDHGIDAIGWRKLTHLSNDVILFAARYVDG